MSLLKLLSQDKIGDFLNLLPISRENLRKTVYGALLRKETLLSST